MKDSSRPMSAKEMRIELKVAVEREYPKESIEEKAVRFQSYWEALLEMGDYVQQKGIKLGELPGALELLPDYALAKYEGIKDRLSWMSLEKREQQIQGWIKEYWKIKSPAQ